MTLEEIIDTCAAMGICLRVEAGKLKAAPPPAPPLLDKLRLHRDAIIGRLEGLPPMPAMAPLNPEVPPQDMVEDVRGKRISCPGRGNAWGHTPPDPAVSSQLDPPMPPINFPAPAEKYAPPHTLLSAQRQTVPDPVDLAERAAIFEADGVSRGQAEALALAEAGFPSWEAYAVSLAA